MRIRNAAAQAQRGGVMQGPCPAWMGKACHPRELRKGTCDAAGTPARSGGQGAAAAGAGGRWRRRGLQARLDQTAARLLERLQVRRLWRCCRAPAPSSSLEAGVPTAPEPEARSKPRRPACPPSGSVSCLTVRGAKASQREIQRKRGGEGADQQAGRGGSLSRGRHCRSAAEAQKLPRCPSPGQPRRGGPPSTGAPTARGSPRWPAACGSRT